jgi:hypothetical protein
MPRRGSPYGYQYEQRRAVILQFSPRCHIGADGCTKLATTIDHRPPIALHHHVDGTHCCAEVPACAHCNYATSGGWSSEQKRARRAKAKQVGTIPPPSRDW